MEEGVRNHSTPRYSSSIKGRHEKVGKCPIVRYCGNSLRIEINQSLVLKRFWELRIGLKTERQIRQILGIPSQPRQRKVASSHVQLLIILAHLKYFEDVAPHKRSVFGRHDIKINIVPHLSKASRGPATRKPLDRDMIKPDRLKDKGGESHPAAAKGMPRQAIIGISHIIICLAVSLKLAFSRFDFLVVHIKV